MAGKQPKPGVRKKGPTAAQRRAWEEMRVLSEAWNIIREEHRLAWNAAARASRRGGGCGGVHEIAWGGASAGGGWGGRARAAGVAARPAPAGAAGAGCL